MAENILSRPPSEIAIPAIVLYELKVGIEKSRSSRKRETQLQSFTSHVKVLLFGKVEAAYAAKVRANLELRGEPIGPYDILIAATAHTHDATLVTHNIREFKRVPDLKVVDWY